MHTLLDWLNCYLLCVQLLSNTLSFPVKRLYKDHGGYKLEPDTGMPFACGLDAAQMIRTLHAHISMPRISRQEEMQ